MSATLDATYGGKTANTYLLLVDVSVIVTEQLFSSKVWTKASDDDKIVGVLTASRHIDSYNWEGVPYFYNQLRCFPRVPAQINTNYGPYGLGEPDSNFATFILQDEYLRIQKDRVLRACAIQTLYVVENKVNPDRDAQFRGLGSRSSSGAGVGGSSSYVRPSHRLCPEAYDELRLYIAPSRLLRG